MNAGLPAQAQRHGSQEKTRLFYAGRFATVRH
jgi:hypothetical protein